jgi:hypothetical protein
MLNSNAGRYHLDFDHVLMMEEWHAQEQQDGSNKASRHYPELIIYVSVSDEAIPENQLFS